MDGFGEVGDFSASFGDEVCELVEFVDKVTV